MDFEVRLTLSVDEVTGETNWAIFVWRDNGQLEMADYGTVGQFMTRREMAERMVRQLTRLLPRNAALMR